jgi:hypothetical protein
MVWLKSCKYIYSEGIPDALLNYLWVQIMGILRKIGEYLYLVKRDPNEPTSSWIKYMNRINRISIFMFLIGIIIILFRLIFHKK